MNTLNKKNKNANKFFEIDELILPYSKLRFCSEQLQNLNYSFQKHLRNKIDTEKVRKIQLAKSVCERLLQYLISGVGQLDARFSNKYLITLNDDSYITDENNINIDYLIRIDALSTPYIYATSNTTKHAVLETDIEHPSGYAKIRLNSQMQKLWNEFVNSKGYLRRDKVQTRYVQLLAQIATNDNLSSPLQVDESLLNASPGKVIDAFTLREILKRPCEEHIYYGQGGNTPRFPDPRDFRLAIVDDPTGVKLRIEFLSPALASISIDVRLLLAIEIDAWPSSTDFPNRIPLGHTDCLLYYKASQTGLYLTSNSLYTTGWKMEMPAAEVLLLNNYSLTSTVRAILNCLYIALKKIHIDYNMKVDQMTYRILNRSLIRTVLFHELEKDYSMPSIIIFNWSPIYMSSQILRILDGLISYLSEQKLPNYFFTKSNMLANPGYLCEEDYAVEAHKIKTYMIKLFDESLMSLKNNLQFQNMLSSQKAEILLLQKWNELQKSLLPYNRQRNRIRRRLYFCKKRYSNHVIDVNYSNRQLEYVGYLLKNMVLVKEKVLQLDDMEWMREIGHLHHTLDNPIEDIVYVLVAIMEQARDLHLRNTYTLNPVKIKTKFDTFTSKLIESLRKDKTIYQLNTTDDISFVKIVLKWLHKSLDFNKKYLQLILKPYLELLYNTSHSMSFYLESLRERDCIDEIESFGIFSRLINLREITPAQGLVDAINKNWLWAKDMLQVLELTNLRIVLVPDINVVSRYMLSLPKDDKNIENDEIDLNKIEKIDEHTKSRNYLSTIARKVNKIENKDDLLPIYTILKCKSPMTLLIDKIHRRGEHRCGGDIFQTLMLMQKTNLIHEMAIYLPDEERLELIEAIHKLTTEKNKRYIHKRWSNTLPPTSKTILYPYKEYDNQNVQRYIKKDESAGIKYDDYQLKYNTNNLLMMKNIERKADTLIGSCRVARIKEDNNNGLHDIQERFKTKSLINKQRY